MLQCVIKTHFIIFAACNVGSIGFHTLLVDRTSHNSSIELNLVFLLTANENVDSCDIFQVSCSLKWLYYERKPTQIKGERVNSTQQDTWLIGPFFFIIENIKKQEMLVLLVRSKKHGVLCSDSAMTFDQCRKDALLCLSLFCRGQTNFEQHTNSVIAKVSSNHLKVSFLCRLLCGQSRCGIFV